MSEIKALVEKTIVPPGVTKKNRSALFSTISDVADIVRTDALKAFNAHFPYLADSAKLEEHGNALLVPHLVDDNEKEYRDRVSTASFFLMRAGERAYIVEQLSAHFGERYVLSDEFLQIYVKILDLDDTDRSWVQGFLDGLLNPNISLSVVDWFRYVENVFTDDDQNIAVVKDDLDTYPTGGLRYDGRILCDQGEQALCDGEFLCDGSINCEGFIYKCGTVRDFILKSVYADGSWRCTGETDCSGYVRHYSPEYIPDTIMPIGNTDTLDMNIAASPMVETPAISAVCNGTFFCDGSNRQSVIDAPMRIRIIKPLVCDGTKKQACSLCDGSIICDGLYSCYDGHYYRDEILQEVA